MVIRSIDAFFGEQRLLQSAPISILKGCKLLFDGHLWIKRLLNQGEKDCLPMVMGGVPTLLENNIIREIQRYKEHEIEPTFVFSSIVPSRNDNPFSVEDKRPLKRAEGWEAFEKGDATLAHTHWNNAASIYYAELLSLVLKTLSKYSIKFIRSPYSSWSQMAYLAKNGVCHAVFSGVEVMLFGLDKCITTINFEKKLFTFVQKSRVLQELNITDDQFLDAVILAGFDYSTTFPPIETDSNHNVFKAALEMVKHHKSGYNCVQAFSEHPEVVRTNYIDNFCKASIAVRYQPFLSNSGSVEPPSAELAPNDLQIAIGHRLPDEVYYYLSRGLLSLQAIHSLINGHIVEREPLCNGESKEYRKMLKDLLELRSQSMALFTRHLHGFFQSRKVKIHYWFEPEAENYLIPYDTVKIPKLLTSKWRCDQKMIDEEKKRQEFDGESELYFCVRAVHAPNFMAINDSSSPTLMSTTDQIVITALMRFLELRGLLDHPEAKYPYGIGFTKAISGFESLPNDNLEGLVLALELIRLGVLNNAPFEPEYLDPELIHVPEEARPHVRLISRVFCLLPMYLIKAPWSGPINRNLLCFQSCIKTLVRTLRQMIEVIATGIVLGGETTKPRKDITDIALRLPFSQEPSTALGVMVKFYLSRVCQFPNKDIHHWLGPNQLPHHFPCSSDVEEDLLIGFDFWDQVVMASTALAEQDPSMAPLAAQFKEADAWLGDKRL